MSEATNTLTVNDSYWETGEGLRGTNFTVEKQDRGDHASFLFTVVDHRDGDYNRLLPEKPVALLRQWFATRLGESKDSVTDLWESGEGLRGVVFSIHHTGGGSFIFSILYPREGAYTRVVGPEVAQGLLDWLTSALA